ncbi:MAG: hypothetical protein IKO62_10800 [Bacteroidales bacterium]|nr:hypothetical protein [Bacteroidales bacterium]
MPSLAAFGHARGKQQKKYLRSKGFLACKDACGSEEISNLARNSPLADACGLIFFCDNDKSDYKPLGAQFERMARKLSY